jgi:hypothetical protein
MGRLAALLQQPALAVRLRVRFQDDGVRTGAGVVNGKTSANHFCLLNSGLAGFADKKSTSICAIFDFQQTRL